MMLETAARETNMAAAFVRRVVKTVYISSHIPDLASYLTKRCPNVEFVNVPVGCSEGN